MSIKNLRKLDLNLLLILNTLIDERHVSRSAKKLGLTQSAVSHALARLRHHFDDPLFVRDGHAMTPTTFAMGIQDDLHIILGSIENLTHHNKLFNAKTCDRTFTIGLPEYLGVPFLTRINEALTKFAPHIKIITFNTNLQATTDALHNNDADIVISRHTTQAKAINHQALYTENYACAIGKGHPLFKKKRITLKDYIGAQHLHISLKAKDKGYIDEHLKVLGQERDIRMTISNYLLGLVMLEKNTLILTEPKQTVCALQNRLKIRVFKPPFKNPDIQVAQFWHRKFDNDRAHKWLRTVISDIASDF